jgi:outer membrane protein assembly factor BamB
VSNRLTDAELIDVVQRKSVEQLTDDERRAIAARLDESPEFLETLVGRFDMGDFVEAVMQAESAAKVAAQETAEQSQTAGSRWRFVWGVMGVVLAGGFLLMLAGVFDGRKDKDPDKEKQQASNGNGTEKKKPKKPNDAKKNKPKIVKKKGPPKVVDPQTPTKLVTAKEPEREPWEADLNGVDPPRPFAQTAFEIPVFSPEHQFPGDLLKRWLDAVPGEKLTIQNQNTQKGQYAAFTGLARLRAPWPKDAVLRLGLFDLQSMQLTFWNGARGVSLRYYPSISPGLWAAYGVTRDKQTPRPTTWTLLTTDNTRHAASGLGPFDVRYQEGELVVTRSDVRLLTVPFSAPPADVFLEGKATVSLLEMYCGEAVPDDVNHPAPNVLTTNQPAALPWGTEIVEGETTTRRALNAEREPGTAWQTEIATGTTLSGSDDGRVELISKSPTPIAVSTLLKQPGLHEVILKIADAEPGTGFFLGDANGRPLQRIGFFRDQKTGQTLFGYAKVGSAVEQLVVNPATQLAAFTGADQWLRLVWGVGTLKVWVSGDGVHWGRALASPVSSVDGVFSTLGLYANGIPKGKQPDTKRISLEHLEVRELTGVIELAAVEVREKVPSVDLSVPIAPGDWLLRVLRTRPVDVPLDQWRRAWVIRTLEAGTTRALGRLLLLKLAEETVTLDRPASERIRTLDEISLLLDTWPSGYGVEMTAFYDRLGIALAEADEEEIVDRWPSVLVRAPVWTQAKWDRVPPSVTQFHLTRQVYAGEWESVRTLCRSVRFWARTAHPDWRPTATGIHEQNMCDWADAVAARRLPFDDVRNLPLLPRSQRHPLAWEVGKEGYNVMAEFESALRSEAFEDAAQIVSVSGAAEGLGLLPDAQDDDLLVSFPRAVATAMGEHAELRAAMQKKFGSLGLLRVRQAMTDGDVEFVQAATTRYYGTSAALAAHRWLGDRELVTGRFARALEHYDRLVRGGSDEDRRHVAARMQLVTALLGRKADGSVDGSIEFGETVVDAKQFAAIVKELSARATNNVTTPTVTAANTEGAAAALPPGGYDAILRAVFQGDAGRNAGQHRSAGWDWLARELAVVADDKRFYVSNRLQLNAYDVVNGKLLWSAPLGNEQGDARYWPLTAMRPVLAGERLFARRVTQRGTELVCLGATDGKVKWRQRPDNHIASDPVFVSGRLVALLATVPLTQFVQIEVASFDPATGELLSREPVMRLRDDWYQKPPCSIRVIDDGLIVAVGGSIVRCDVSGRPQWLRKQIWMPRTLDLKWYDLHVARPLVDGKHVYIAQPHARSVLCLDQETGRARWRLGEPGLQRLLGVTAGRLVYRTTNGLVAVDAGSGKRVWKRDVPELLAAYSVDETGGVMFAQRVRHNATTAWPVLVWLDGKTGQELGHRPLAALSGKTPMLGPLFSAGGKRWTFYGKGPTDMRRDIVEFVPNAAARLQMPRSNEISQWLLQGVPAGTLSPGDGFGGWDLASSTVAPKYLADYAGEKHVIKTWATKASSANFIRRIDVPAEGKPRLELRVGHVAKKSWRLTVRADATELLATDVKDESTGKTGWLGATVNLSSLKGRTIWIVVSQSVGEGTSTAVAYWKQLEFRTD